MLLITPDTGDGTSVSTLSVEISTSGSSSAMRSPTCFIQRSTVPSVTVSPSCGIETVVDIVHLPMVCDSYDISVEGKTGCAHQRLPGRFAQRGMGMNKGCRLLR